MRGDVPYRHAFRSDLLDVSLGDENNHPGALLNALCHLFFDTALETLLIEPGAHTLVVQKLVYALHLARQNGADTTDH